VHPVLCLVTDRARYGGVEALVDAVARAAEAGVHLVQVRERDLEARALLTLVERCVAAVRGTRARVLVNDRLDVAIAAGAHGVHLPSSGAPAERLRAAAPRRFVIGRSVHARDEAVAAATGRALDYLLFGTVFSSASKPGAAPAGLDALHGVASAVAIPVLAIGGMTAERAAAAAAAGAAGVAAIGLFAEAARGGSGAFAALVARVSSAFDTAGAVR
jgi:thiamine-phosphate pyrophosphorylase